MSRPNRGERFVRNDGYVMLWVGIGHHLATSSKGNYAYEHRVVAERKLGRRLLPGEIVHHINHDKSDNRPENLEVHPSPHSHAIMHRTPDSTNRNPGECNPLVLCQCGCGSRFEKFDSMNRLREFVSGHSLRGTQGVVYRLFQENPDKCFRFSEVFNHLKSLDINETNDRVYQILGVMRKNNRIQSPAPGKYIKSNHAQVHSDDNIISENKLTDKE